jgi:NADH:ubiquinone oxidoreductase subunit 3 (subunit A)
VAVEKHIPNIIVIVSIFAVFFLLEAIGYLVRPRAKNQESVSDADRVDLEKDIIFSPQFQMITTSCASVGLIVLVLLAMSVEFSGWSARGSGARATAVILVFLAISFAGLLYGKSRGDLNWKDGRGNF